jgi:hypothetical protein
MTVRDDDYMDSHHDLVKSRNLLKQIILGLVNASKIKPDDNLRNVFKMPNEMNKCLPSFPFITKYLSLELQRVMDYKRAM